MAVRGVGVLRPPAPEAWSSVLRQEGRRRRLLRSDCRGTTYLRRTCDRRADRASRCAAVTPGVRETSS